MVQDLRDPPVFVRVDPGFQSEPDPLCLCPIGSTADAQVRYPAGVWVPASPRQDVLCCVLLACEGSCLSCSPIRMLVSGLAMNCLAPGLAASPAGLLSWLSQCRQCALLLDAAWSLIRAGFSVLIWKVPINHCLKEELVKQGRFFCQICYLPWFYLFWIMFILGKASIPFNKLRLPGNPCM